MSHRKLREEKNCLNCGQTVEDRYCPHCGQENLVIRDSAFHMMIHYVQDLFHYDGKLWHTLKNLFLKPGQVPAEYMEGKRQQNLEPIRFYVFASTVYFILMFLLIGKIEVGGGKEEKVNYSKRIYSLKQERKFASPLADTVLLDTIIMHVAKTSNDTSILKSNTGLNRKVSDDLELEMADDTTNWFNRRFNKKIEEISEESERGEAKTFSQIINDTVHKLPQLLFLSLPVFAFLLYLFNLNNKRQYYVDHFIFSTYLYAYIFILLLGLQIVVYCLSKISSTSLSPLPGLLIGGISVYMLFYLLFAMKRYYGNSYIITFLKFSAILFLFLFVLLFLGILFFIVSFLS